MMKIAKKIGGGCRDMDNIVFFYVQLINHHIYILNYAVIRLKLQRKLRFPAIMIIIY